MRSDINQQLAQNRQELSSSLRSVNNDFSALTENINSKFDWQFKDLQNSNEQKLEKNFCKFGRIY